MALMDKPTPEDMNESAETVALEEDGNVEEENITYSGAVAFVNSQFTRAKDARFTDEDRWLTHIAIIAVYIRLKYNLRTLRSQKHSLRSLKPRFWRHLPS
jgi:hypothetical protein